MNEHQFLVMIEKLLALYKENHILDLNGEYSAAFQSLIGEAADALSNVE